MLDVRVPTLGAYAVNKAYTFSRRGTPANPDETPKSAKDLLYIHDVMAAGPAVVEQIERDVSALAKGSPADAEQNRGAASHLGLALAGGDADLGRHLASTVSMLLERKGTSSQRAAAAQLRGHLTDLHDILSSAIDDDPGEEGFTRWEQDDGE